jgi:hypothetical protein
MATQAMTGDMGMEGAQSGTFERLAGISAIVAGVAGFLYSIAFVFLKQPLLYSILLMVGGLATGVVLVGLYRRLREVDSGLAQWATIIGVVASLGSVIHGGYDLGNAINPPAGSNLDLPSQIDPRGLLTFGVAGLALFGFSWLMLRGGRFPKNLAYLAYLLAVLLVVIYLGRLIILDANSYAVLIPAGMTGFIVNPAWNIWLGLSFLRKTS